MAKSKIFINTKTGEVVGEGDLLEVNFDAADVVKKATTRKRAEDALDASVRTALKNELTSDEVTHLVKASGLSILAIDGLSDESANANTAKIIAELADKKRPKGR